MFGCLGSSPNNSITFNNNNEDIKIENYNISEKKIIDNNYENLSYRLEVNNFTDNYINMSLNTPGSESGCYYSYKDINSLNISENYIIVNMDFKKELKEEKRGLFLRNCEEYSRPIAVSRNISISGDNFEQLDNVYMNYSNYNKTYPLK